MQSTKIFYYAKLMLILLLSIMIFITLSGIILAQNNSIKYKYPNVVADQTAREISLKNNKSNALISFYIAIQYISNYKSTDDMFEVMKWYELAGCKEWKMLYIFRLCVVFLLWDNCSRAR